MDKRTTGKTKKSRTGNALKDLPGKVADVKSDEAVTGGFCGFIIPTAPSTGTGKASTSEIAVTKKMD